MNNTALKMTTRLRTSGTILILGLLVEGFSLLWNHPLSFIAFATAGMFLIFAGIVFYLFSLLAYAGVEEEIGVDHTKA